MRRGISEHACRHTANVFAGGWRVEPTPTITGNIADTYPSSGQFTITTGSQILIVTINSNVAADANAVTISLDSNPPQNYSWDELVAVV